MSPLLIRVILRCYPAKVRARYGDELAELLESSPTPTRDVADIARCAVADRWEGVVTAYPRSWKLLWLLAPALIVAAMFYDPQWYGRLLVLLLASIGILAGAWLGDGQGEKWYQHPLIALVLIGVAWLFPFERGWIRLIVFVVWVAGAMGIAFLVRRMRRAENRFGAVVAGSLCALVLLHTSAIGLVFWIVGVSGLATYEPMTHASGGKHTTQAAEVGLTLT